MRKEYNSLNGFKRGVFYFLLSRFTKGIVLSDSLKENLIPFIDESKINEPGFNKNAYFLSELLDYVFSTIYLFEFLIKAITMGFILDKNCYISTSWNKLDFIIVVASVNEYVIKFT